MIETLKLSELKPGDVLVIKSNDAMIMFDLEDKILESFKDGKITFRPKVVTLRESEDISILQEETLNAMGYFRKKED